MEVQQVYTVLNTITQEVLGETAIVKEDLTNVIDIGKAFENAKALDNYVKALPDVIGKMVFVNRIYTGRAPSVLMDGWEYGSILEKVYADIPEADENKSWELVDGQSYDTNIFYKPTVHVKLFNSKTTFEIPMSFTRKQVLESFNNAVQLNAFYSMIYASIANSMTIKNDALIMRTIDNFIAETVNNSYGSEALNTKSTVKAVNLLYLYNQKFNTTLTAEDSVTDADFIRYATLEMRNTAANMKSSSTLFNIGGTPKFTPQEDMHIVMLAPFYNAAEVYLYNTTIDKVQLPEAETVPYWQGSGEDFGFDSVSKIDIKTSSGADVTVTGVLGFIFDRDALGVCNRDPRTTSHYVESAEFWNEWHKMDASYFNDFNENGVVFFVA